MTSLKDILFLIWTNLPTAVPSWSAMEDLRFPSYSTSLNNRVWYASVLCNIRMGWCSFSKESKTCKGSGFNIRADLCLSCSLGWGLRCLPTPTLWIDSRLVVLLAFLVSAGWRTISVAFLQTHLIALTFLRKIWKRLEIESSIWTSLLKLKARFWWRWGWRSDPVVRWRSTPNSHELNPISDLFGLPEPKAAIHFLKQAVAKFNDALATNTHSKVPRVSQFKW